MPSDSVQVVVAERRKKRTREEEKEEVERERLDKLGDAMDIEEEGEGEVSFTSCTHPAV